MCQDQHWSGYLDRHEAIDLWSSPSLDPAAACTSGCSRFPPCGTRGTVAARTDPSVVIFDAGLFEMASSHVGPGAEGVETDRSRPHLRIRQRTYEHSLDLSGSRHLRTRYCLRCRWVLLQPALPNHLRLLRLHGRTRGMRPREDRSWNELLVSLVAPLTWSLARRGNRGHNYSMLIVRRRAVLTRLIRIAKPTPFKTWRCRWSGAQSRQPLVFRPWSIGWTARRRVWGLPV